MDTDQYYTQGFKLAYLHTDNHVPDWVKNLSETIPALGYAVHANRIGLQAGQDIYTPSDINSANLLPHDRPYAGWLYAGFIFQRLGLTSSQRPVLENLQLNLGVIGPESLAEEAQAWAHNNDPQGWTHQLKTEPGVALQYQRSWLFSPSAYDRARYLDFIPYTGLSLGNVDTSFRAGGIIRLGVNLPDDFGQQTIHSLTTTGGGWSGTRRAERSGFYVYVRAEGRAVGYSTFLNGNLWRDSNSVTPEPLVGEFAGGIALVLPRFEVTISGVYTTPEFTTQPEYHAYGSLGLKFNL